MFRPDEDEMTMVRSALRERIREVGLRRTAREVGMSPAALSALVESGSRPYRRTWELLRAWHAGQLESPPPPDARETRRALLALTRDLSPAQRHRVVRRLERVLRDARTPAGPAEAHAA